jgi:hypothetical protein
MKFKALAIDTGMACSNPVQDKNVYKLSVFSCDGWGLVMS